MQETRAQNVCRRLCEQCLPGLTVGAQPHRSLQVVGPVVVRDVLAPFVAQRPEHLPEHGAVHEADRGRAHSVAAQAENESKFCKQFITF